MAKKIQLIIGSTRQKRFGPYFAEWIVEQAVSHADLQIEVIDLKEVGLPFFDSAISPMYAPDTSEAGTAWAAKVADTDGFILLTSEYNKGYPAPLKNAIDFLYKEWNDRPALVFSYGYLNGGMHANDQLHQVMTQIKMVPLPTTVGVQLSPDFFSDSGGFKHAKQDLAAYVQPLQTALGELVAAIEAAPASSKTA